MYNLHEVSDLEVVAHRDPEDGLYYITALNQDPLYSEVIALIYVLLLYTTSATLEKMGGPFMTLWASYSAAKSLMKVVRLFMTLRAVYLASAILWMVLEPLLTLMDLYMTAETLMMVYRPFLAWFMPQLGPWEVVWPFLNSRSLYLAAVTL
jgi:hypothetical protein